MIKDEFNMFESPSKKPTEKEEEGLSSVNPMSVDVASI